MRASFLAGGGGQIGERARPSVAVESRAPMSDPLDPRRERIVVLALTSGAFAMALNTQVMAALMPFLEPELVPDKAAKGQLVAAAGFAGAVGALLLGPWVDRFGRRMPLGLGLAVFAVASFLHLFATDATTLLALRALSGFSVGVAYTGASAAIADLVPYSRRGAAMGIFTAGIFLATPIGLPLANLWATAGHWRWIFVAQGGFGIAALVVCMRVLPAGLGASGRGTSLVKLLRRPMVVPLLLAIALATGSFFAFVQFAGEWLHDVRIVPREQQAWMWISLGLCSAVGSIVLGRYVDRVGKRTFVLASTAALAFLLGLMMRVGDIGMLLAVGLPMTFVAAARTAAFQTLSSEIVPPAMRGALMGLRGAAVQGGQGLFLAIGGGVYADHGFNTFLWLTVGGVAASYLLIRLFVHEERGEYPAPVELSNPRK